MCEKERKRGWVGVNRGVFGAKTEENGISDYVRSDISDRRERYRLDHGVELSRWKHK